MHIGEKNSTNNTTFHSNFEKIFMYKLYYFVLIYYIVINIFAHLFQKIHDSFQIYNIHL